MDLKTTRIVTLCLVVKTRQIFRKRDLEVKEEMTGYLLGVGGFVAAAHFSRLVKRNFEKTWVEM